MAEGGVPGRRKSTNGSSVVEKSRVLSQARKKPEHRAEGEQDKEGTGGSTGSWAAEGFRG